jgi:hypothetical protein
MVRIPWVVEQDISFLNNTRTCPVTQEWIYGHDAITEAEKVLKGEGYSVHVLELQKMQ